MPETCYHCKITIDRGTNNDTRCAYGYENDDYDGCCNCAKEHQIFSDQDYEEEACRQCKARSGWGTPAGWRPPAVVAAERAPEERRAAEAIAAAEAARRAEAAAEEARLAEVGRVAEAARRAEEELRAEAERQAQAARDAEAAEKARLVGPGNARAVAAGSFSGVARLARCAGAVLAARRPSGGNSAASVLAEVAGFAALRAELEGGVRSPPLSGAATLGGACAAAEEGVRESREKLEASQREVRRCAQRRHRAKEAPAQGEGAAGGVDEAVQTRDLQRAQHSRVLLSSLSKVVRAAEASYPATGNSTAVSVAAAREGRPQDAGARATTAATGWAGAAAQQEQGLARALAAAAECRDAYAAAHGGANAMGSSEAALPDAAASPDGRLSLPRAALGAYAEWAGRVGADVAAAETDAALQAMQEAGATSFGRMFTSGADAEQHMLSVEAAMLRSGAALEAEFDAQATDFLAGMPSHLLMSAGRQLLEERKSEREAMTRVREVVSEIVRELEMVQQSLDNTGTLRKSKEEAVEEFTKASKQAKKTQRNLTRAKLELEEAVEEEEQSGSPAGLEQVEQLSAAAAASEAEVRSQRARMKRALSSLARFEPDFPEVMVHLESALPRELLQVWRPDCALEDMFVAREKLRVGGRHAVWRCSDGEEGGEEFAVKEFRVVTDLRASLREAALLMRMRHPFIVSVVAVFQDTIKGSVMLQMPYYAHGSIDVWVKSESAPGWRAVRTVLQDVTAALAHLHVNKVCHADVKPPNILVGAGERGKLADFDISVDSNTRTTQQYFATTRMAFGHTPGFEAPELPQTGSTPASDMFALGKTVEKLCDACTEGGSAASAAEVADLVRVLTADAAKDRPSADAAAAHAFFKPLLDFCREQTSKCCICMDLVRHSDGALCAEGHLTCRACLDGHVQNSAGEELRLLRQREGRVFCPNSGGGLGCAAAPFSDSELGQSVSAEVFESYIKGRMRLLESRLREEVEEEAEGRLQAELLRLQELDEAQREVLAARKHVEDQILTMRCPRCRTAYLDFEGCCALSCSKCPCNFCAWCGADCGADAHRHVGSCVAKPAGVDGVFSRVDVVERAQKVRRAAALESFLGGLGARTREALLREMLGTLREHYSQVLRVFGV